MSNAKRLIDNEGGGLSVDEATATNQNATATNQNATATNQNATATNQNAPQLCEVSMIPAAPGVAMHATFPGGSAAPINSAGPFTTQIPARTCRVVLGAGGANPVRFTVTGHTVFGGDPVSDEIVATGPGTYEGVVAFDDVTTFVSDVDPIGDVDLQTGKGFSLGPQTGLSGGIVQTTIGVDGVKEVAPVAEEITGTVVPVTTPDGMKVYTVRYTRDLYVVQNPHTHAQDPHTHAQNPHTHGLS